MKVLTICTLCEKRGEASVKDYIRSRKLDIICTSCGAKVEFVIRSSERRQPRIGFEATEAIKIERLELLKKKAIDLGLDAKIERDELFVRGDSEKIKFFEFSKDVFSVSQLLSYKISSNYLYALGLLKGKQKDVTQDELFKQFTEEETLEFVDIRIEGK